MQGQAVIVAQSSPPLCNRAPVALDDGAHFFSGGLGGLGLLTARALVEGGARQLILSSRSDRVMVGSESDWAWLAECGSDVRRARCDASDDAAVHGVVCALLGAGVRLGGIFHAAHQLADAVLSNQEARNFRATYGYA